MSDQRKRECLRCQSQFDGTKRDLLCLDCVREGELARTRKLHKLEEAWLKKLAKVPGPASDAMRLEATKHALKVPCMLGRCMQGVGKPCRTGSNVVRAPHKVRVDAVLEADLVRSVPLEWWWTVPRKNGRCDDCRKQLADPLCAYSKEPRGLLCKRCVTARGLEPGMSKRAKKFLAEATA